MVALFPTGRGDSRRASIKTNNPNSRIAFGWGFARPFQREEWRAPRRKHPAGLQSQPLKPTLQAGEAARGFHAPGRLQLAPCPGRLVRRAQTWSHARVPVLYFPGGTRRLRAPFHLHPSHPAKERAITAGAPRTLSALAAASPSACRRHHLSGREGAGREQASRLRHFPDPKGTGSFYFCPRVSGSWNGG